MRSLLLIAVLALGGMAHAEYTTYGYVQLQGLSRDTGSINPPGLADVMVCNVNGADKWLAVRAGAGTNFKILRKIERLAILRVDSESRYGHWVYVTMGYRTHTKKGYPLADVKDLNVSGWVHDGYLCDFYFL